MATGDIFQIVTKTVVNSNEGLNVWYCRAVDETADAEIIAQATIDEMFPQLATFLSGETLLTEAKVTNLFDASDQATIGSAVAGGAGTSDDVLPLHDAVGVTLEHNNPAIRKGAKRFMGLGEAGSAEYGVLTATYQTTIDDALNNIVDLKVRREVSPSIYETLAEYVIVQVIPEVIEGVTGYRLPTSIAEAVYGLVTSAIVKSNITTQVSRKPE